ncbi:hypothetical protein DFH09DRAFT_1091695 [Mycena vulgaris]|nr:hypothetical protein DFH09DRAFT_1091695 [Mycena vulgaris]
MSVFALFIMSITDQAVRGAMGYRDFTNHGFDEVALGGAYICSMQLAYNNMETLLSNASTAAALTMLNHVVDDWDEDCAVEHDKIGHGTRFTCDATRAALYCNSCCEKCEELAGNELASEEESVGDSGRRVTAFGQTQGFLDRARLASSAGLSVDIPSVNLRPRKRDLRKSERLWHHTALPWVIRGYLIEARGELDLDSARGDDIYTESGVMSGVVSGLHGWMEESEKRSWARAPDAEGAYGGGTAREWGLVGGRRRFERATGSEKSGSNRKGAYAHVWRVMDDVRFDCQLDTGGGGRK